MTPATTTTTPLTAALLNVAMGFSSDNWPILYARRAHSDNINRLARRYYSPSPEILLYTRLSPHYPLLPDTYLCSRSKPYAYLTGGRNEVLPEFAFRSSRRCTLCRHAPVRQTRHARTQPCTPSYEKNNISQ